MNPFAHSKYVKLMLKYIGTFRTYCFDLEFQSYVIVAYYCNGEETISFQYVYLSLFLYIL